MANSGKRKGKGLRRHAEPLRMEIIEVQPWAETHFIRTNQIQKSAITTAYLAQNTRTWVVSGWRMSAVKMCKYLLAQSATCEEGQKTGVEIHTIWSLTVECLRL